MDRDSDRVPGILFAFHLVIQMAFPHEGGRPFELWIVSGKDIVMVTIVDFVMVDPGSHPHLFRTRSPIL